MESKYSFRRIVTLLICMFGYASCREWKPTLLERSGDKSYYTNVKINMFCKFNATPPTTVTWSKDGKEIKESKRVTFGPMIQGASEAIVTYQLSINQAINEDRGTYTCLARNSVGAGNGSIIIGIIENYAPQIADIPDAILYVGQTFRTQCTADALPYATYSWQKRSAFIDKRRVQDNGDGELLFKGVRIADQGEYICIATNTAGESMRSFKVRVVKDPSWIVQSHNYTETFYGRSLKIDNTFTGSTNGLVITWFKNGEIFPDSQRRAISGGNGTFIETALTFSPARLEDNGEYTVEVTNNEGSISTKTSLVVFSKPQILIREGANASVQLGNTLILLCTVKSVPTSTVTWEFNKTVVASNNQVDDQKQNVELAYAIRDAKQEDQGSYFCMGKNKFGTSRYSVRVQVKKPSVVSYGESSSSGSSGTLIIAIACVAVLFIICIVVITILLIRYQKRRSSLPVAYSPSTASKDSAINIVPDPASMAGGTDATHSYDHPLLRHDQQEKGAHKKPLLSKYRRGTTSKSQSEENILPGRGVLLEPYQIKEGPEIGSGKFGCILHKGEVTIEAETKTVAIKQLKEDADEKDKLFFTAELETLKKLSHHPNIIGLVGWCSVGNDIKMVTEFGLYGSLLNFLRTFKKGLHGQVIKSEAPIKLDFDLNEKDLLSFGWQVASGMKYLSSMNIVHRDLAARNVLLGHEHVCKIVNFGIDKEGIYGSAAGGDLPLQWMGFESIFKGEFTSKSDVWSYGVLLWEISTLGDYPYPGFSTPDELINALKEGYRMDKPIHCSDGIYDLMMSCWQQSPAHRPDFAELCSRTGSMLCDFDSHIDFEILKQSLKETEGMEDAM